MPNDTQFNLFVYGTLMNPSVFRAVLGRRLALRAAEADGKEVFHARRAVLNGYKKISPDNTYLYAVPSPHGRIRGYLVTGLPRDCLAALRQYEGKNYVRRTVRLQTARGPEKAIAFLSNDREMAHSFGHQFRDHFKQEILLERKIEAALLETEREQLRTVERDSRRAIGELRGDKIRDLRRRHFESGGISDYVIRHSLKDAPLPDFDRIADDPEARALAPNYLSMVVRQVIFNELEEHIHRDFRYELDHMDLSHVYYDRTISSLAALRMLNSNKPMLRGVVTDCLSQLSFPDDRLVDFVRWSIRAGDELYASDWAKREIDFIWNHMGSGYTPLGAELEFSNIGHSVIRDPNGEGVQDSRYDGFLYFRDFGLDVLTWRLGGHLDDHHKKFSHQPRRGFFEVALGNVSVEANLSKPITDDPWLLSQFIHQARQFYEITPHSVHISMQIRGRVAQNRMLPLAAMKCLFAVGGDPVRNEDGRLILRRLVGDEIISAGDEPHMLFSDVGRRHSSDSETSHPLVRTPKAGGRYVQQYKFLRLGGGLNYEPIIMALKGIQIHSSPGSFLSAAQHARSRKHRHLFADLLAWGADAEEIPADEIEVFLSAAYEGLMTERRGKPAHSGAYIAWTMDRLRSALADFNRHAAGDSGK